MADCPEIQDKWDMSAGDCFKIIEGKYYVGEPCDGGSEYFEGDICYADEQSVCFDFSDKKYLWLPRIDQLIEMLDLDISDLILVFKDAEKLFRQENSMPDTMEKFILFIVMFELHNKKWTGKEWVT